MRTEVEKKIKYNFKNKTKLNALITGSYSRNKPFHYDEMSKYALKGDAVLKICVFDIIDELSITPLNKTELHFLVFNLITNKTLTNIFNKKDFKLCFQYEVPVLKQATYIEGIIGMVYEDSNNCQKITKKVIKAIYLDIIFCLLAEIIKDQADSLSHKKD